MKTLFVLIDGLGDVDGYDTKETPLQLANTPALDKLAMCGYNGLMDPVEPGFACGSDTAHLSILGYNPRTYYRGRGAFEAMGAGLNMHIGDVAFKCNFATIQMKENGDRVVTRRRVDREFADWGLPLCEMLNNIRLPNFPKVKVLVKHATEHRCGIVLRGDGLSDKIVGTDPLKDNLPMVECTAVEEAGMYTSRVVNEVTKVFYDALRTHPINVKRVQDGLPPANIVLLRGPGERIYVDTFEKRYGIKAFMIAPTCIINGLGQSLGMDIVKVQGATGDYHTDIMAKGKAAVKALQEGYDFGFLHIKAVDDAGHDKDMRRKIEFIEKTDGMIESVWKDAGLPKDTVLVVTGDHTTPVRYGDHTFEPVPFTICPIDTTTSMDAVQSFDEQSAGLGVLGRFPGQEVMQIIQNVTNT